jgi:hypothetical protein
MTYTLGEEPTADTIITNTGYAYVLGDVYLSSGIGPVGPIGPSGLRGFGGERGDIGPSGANGASGASVVSYNQQQVGVNQYQLQFIFSDGSIGPWVNMPSGGPSGVAGPSGQRGSFTNHFLGAYSDFTTYTLDDSVSFSGSSYIYINALDDLGNDPTNVSYWQVLAQKGDVGPSGATGYADRYSASFNVVSGFPTGAGSYSSGITGFTFSGVDYSGSSTFFSTGQVMSFRNAALTGYSFTPFQQVIVSTNDYYGTYFYATVNSYNSTSGMISMTPTFITGIVGTTGTYTSLGSGRWYRYGNATINLGANLMSGATGAQGIQGIQGPPGTASAMRCQTYSLHSGQTGSLNPTGLNITGGTGIEMFCVTITGNGTQYYGGDSVILDFNCSAMTTGQSVILKVINSGVPLGNNEPPLFYFTGSGVINSSKIKWPNGLYSRPNHGESYIYTVLRFPDEFGQFTAYGTYSNPYF